MITQSHIIEIRDIGTFAPVLCCLDSFSQTSVIKSSKSAQTYYHSTSISTQTYIESKSFFVETFEIASQSTAVQSLDRGTLAPLIFCYDQYSQTEYIRRISRFVQSSSIILVPIVDNVNFVCENSTSDRVNELSDERKLISSNVEHFVHNERDYTLEEIAFEGLVNYSVAKNHDLSNDLAANKTSTIDDDDVECISTGIVQIYLDIEHLLSCDLKPKVESTNLFENVKIEERETFRGVADFTGGILTLYRCSFCPIASK